MIKYFSKKMNFAKWLIAFSFFSIISINSIYAQITQPTAWTKAYDQTSGTCNTYSFPIAAGSNRILVVAISNIRTTAATQANPTTITYGGQTLTLATTNGTSSGNMHTWIYYLKDNGVMDNTSRPLNVTLTNTHLNVTVWYSVFAGVDQTPGTYTTGNRFSNTSSTTAVSLSVAMAINANEQAVYYSCIVNTTNTTIPVYTINANWTSGGTSTGATTYGWKTQPAKRLIPGTNITDNAATGTINPSSRRAMSAMSLPMYVVPTLTISNPTTAIGAASVCGSSTNVPIHAFRIGATGSAGTLTNFQFTTTGTYTAAEMVNYKILWNTTNTIGTATLLSTNITPGGPGVQTFPAFSLSIPSGSTYFFWITADIASTVVSGNTLTVSGSNSADMTTTSTKAGGPTTASGTQTLQPAPAPVTVSGGGTFCGSATLTASGGTGGTIYWQNTTSNGTSTATPSTSQVVSASGTYYFRAGNGSCWGTQGSATVTINAIPTITLGANPTICQGVTAANLTYSATTGTPNQYSIDYDATSEAQGFVDVVNAALPASPIVLTVPVAAVASTYNYTVTVRNSTTGCVSNTYAKSITLNPLLTTGAISGPASVAPSTAGLIYNIAAVIGATGYIWTVPGGWSITGGSGTISITVTSGIVGQNGNITAAAINGCGTGAASILAVSVVPPHNVCSGCHINHTAPGGAITGVNGNANLCISCHKPGGSASTKPLDNAMKAVPGTSGTSHQWDKPSINGTFESNKTTNSEMLMRLPGDSIICSTCHNQHTTGILPGFLRISNAGDAICKNCHAARNVGRYVDNTAVNKGSHPVGLVYSGTGSLLPSTTGSVTLPGGKIECMSCHKVHYAPFSDGYILRQANDAILCTSCHTYKSHVSMDCKVCHQTHNTNKSNIYMVKNSITTPNSGAKTVVFTALTGAGSFADGAAPYDGVCEVCHTVPGTSGYHLNNSPGTHNNGTNCTSCHKHINAFISSCFDCHNTAQGTRRQIVDNLGTGLGTGGDFLRTSHHVTGSIPTVADCNLCHDMAAHKGGTVRLKDDLGTVYSYDPLNKASVENFCKNCHDANGFGGDLTPFSDNVTAPVVDATMWAASSHKTNGTVNANTCLGCHDNGHGSNKSNLIGPFAYAGPGTGTDLMNEEEGFCIGCHGGTGVASVKVHLAFSTYTNTATQFYKHDPAATYRKHISGETGGASFGGTNRHVECVDCHNPHGVKAGTATAPTLLPTLTGVTGVEPTYAGAGAPTGFIWQSSVTQEYQVCFKCHSSYTTLPTYLPDGIQVTTPIANGLKKLTTGGTNFQIADNRDMAQEYNPNNASFHPVMAAGKNLNINATSFQTGWTYTSRMYCSDCHNNPLATTAGHGKGPHGSSNLHLLDKGAAGTANYATYHSAPNANIVCTKCHKGTGYMTGNTGSRFPYHQYHYGMTATCYDCHDSHGSEVNHNWNFSRNVTSCITAFGASPYNTSQSAFVHAAGTAINACVVTCHGVTHSTSSKTWVPSYN